MNLSVGIVGLPNVGKSTLFNALLKKQLALAANYPFATIEPNVGIVPVPDGRLEVLAKIVAGEEADPAARSSQGAPASLADAANADARLESPSLASPANLPPIKPATVEFLDIAGLVKGAAEGAGLGNRFLSHIREVSVVCHVVRAFIDENIIREGSSDPENDFATIETELMLADLQSAMNIQSRIKRSDDPVQKMAIDKVVDNLNSGIPVREMRFSEEENEYLKTLFFLTAKQELVVLNVSDDEYTAKNADSLVEKYADMLQISRERLVVISAKIEEELAQLSDEEQSQYLADLGFKTSGLERLIQKAYSSLGLISFLTAGEKEVRAWTIRKGSTAVEASGEIHTDFMKKFIKAEVVFFADFVKFGGWKGSREKGKARLEGKDYIMQDGDVVEFKIGA
ncbi:MAG TPA: redox-regulated ATPase YchF [Patescibacteria group bacterium]|nr:redox-regulated ATPase YchF [Patescibacteria group bacterium]